MYFKVKDVLERLMRMVSVPDGEQLLDTDENIAAKQQAMAQQGKSSAQDPAVNQAKVQLLQAQTQKAQGEVQNQAADLQDKAAERQAKAAAQVVESQDRAADRASHLQIAQMKDHMEARKTGAGMAEQQAEQSAVEGEQTRRHEVKIAGLGAAAKEASK